MKMPRDAIIPWTRRRFIESISASSAAIWFAACDRLSSGNGASAGGTATADRVSTVVPDSPWAKDPTPFIEHPTNLETRLELIDGFLTPNELFFVRNHSPTIHLAPEDYRLLVTGDGVESSVQLGLSDLQNLPQTTVTAYLECAGNWRGFFAELTGRPASGGQWATGAVGCAEWTGPTVASVLERAGVRPDAMDVNLVGLDESGFERAMPLEKALDPNTLLALRMNGDPLPADHGFPVRAVVPGWAGSNSVKWVGRIDVSTEKVWNKNNTTSYVLIGDEWPQGEFGPAQGGPITELSVKSAIALARPARLAPGSHRLHGFAHSPHGPVERVEWSSDAGGSWAEAEIVSPVLPLAWQRFEFQWDASAGEHTLMTRATDAAGQVQPDEPLANEKGYLLNVPLPHPVRVE